MTIDSLLMFAAVLVGAYAILPRSRRLDLVLRWHPVTDTAITVAWLLVVHYLILHRVFAARGWTIYRAWPVTSGETAYLVTLGVFVAVALRLRFARLSRHKLPRLRSLVDELLGDRSYTELADVLSRHMPRLSEFAMRRQPWPWNRRRSEEVAASDILRTALHSPGFAPAMALARPYFPLTIPDIKELGLYDFFDAYLRALWSEPSSVLYTEIKNNQGSKHPWLYHVPSTNRLLYFLFGDATTAEHLQAWRPIGDALLAELVEIGRRPDTDEYNTAMGDFIDIGCWSDRLFIGIRYFNIMVSAALIQNVRWHMWMHYLPYVVKEIATNYSPHPLHSEPEAEHPTRYSYLLHEIIGGMRNWVSVVPDLPEGQENLVLRKEDNFPETDSIPKSSIIALCYAMRWIFRAETIPHTLRHSLMEIVFGLYYELYDEPKTVKYARTLSFTLSRGGYGGQRDAELSSAVLCHLDEYDEKDKYSADATNSLRSRLTGMAEH